MSKMSPELLSWLTHRTSLTERLQEEACDARLQVLRQEWDEPNVWDTQVLHLNDKQVLHRDIIMWAHDSACWYARTIIPTATYDANVSLFERLQTESLGELVFNQPNITRLDLRHYSISEQSYEYTWLDKALCGGARELWVRKSEFLIDEVSPLFLIEILLPGLWVVL